jgi:hypothetical protein
MNVPTMNDAERAAFERDVTALFKARWHSQKIRSWAVGAGSGYSRFWESPDHAQAEVDKICRAYNRAVAAENRRIVGKRLAEMDPEVLKLMRRSGAKLRWR